MYIGGHAFRGCRGLTGPLTIPGSVTKIGDDAFDGTPVDAVKILYFLWKFKNFLCALELNLKIY
jgi:hypothetical protein